MREKRCLVDTFSNKLYMVGPGGFEIRLSPGPGVYDLEDSETGHQMLPCSQFKQGRKPTQESQTFLIGTYFDKDHAPSSGDPSHTQGAGSETNPSC